MKHYLLVCGDDVEHFKCLEHANESLRDYFLSSCSTKGYDKNYRRQVEVPDGIVGWVKLTDEFYDEELLNDPQDFTWDSYKKVVISDECLTSGRFIKSCEVMEHHEFLDLLDGVIDGDDGKKIAVLDGGMLKVSYYPRPLEHCEDLAWEAYLHGALQ